MSALSMITVADAEKIVLDHVKMFPEFDCLLEEAYGAFLREEICADRDFPPVNRSTMDGIAISFASWKRRRRSFAIAGMQKAGDARLELSDKKACMEVMTGAALPGGCDCVVPVEQVTLENGCAHVHEDAVLSQWQYLHLQGQDYRRDDVLLPPGVRLNPQHVAVAAAVGKSRLKVTKTPAIAVIGTGNELVEIDMPVKDFQIRRSNSYAVQALLMLRGFDRVQRYHIRDDKRDLLAGLRKILHDFDVVIVSGGVSMGKYDFVPEVLQNLGVVVHFHKVKQRPGKPFWFGTSKDGKPVFALPGNPVSTQICTYRYVLPYLLEACGCRPQDTERCVLAEDFDPRNRLTNFLPVKAVFNIDGQLQASPVPFHVSGNYVSLVQAHGFVELPAADEPICKGTVVRYFRW